jgi:hypothetical protein
MEIQSHREIQRSRRIPPAVHRGPTSVGESETFPGSAGFKVVGGCVTTLAVLPVANEVSMTA